MEMVNHPKHYTSHPSGVEAIEITQHMNFCLGNAFKYMFRHLLKNGKEDLEKAIWYLERQQTIPIVEEFVLPEQVFEKFHKLYQTEPNQEIKRVFEIIFYHQVGEDRNSLNEAIDKIEKLKTKESSWISL